MSYLAGITLSRKLEDLLETELLNHCITHQTSFLCAKLLEEEHPLQVLKMKNPNEWYLGVALPDTGPLTRDSQYFESQKLAEEALGNRCWCQQLDLV